MLYDPWTMYIPWRQGCGRRCNSDGMDFFIDTAIAWGLDHLSTDGMSIIFAQHDVIGLLVD